MSAASWEREPGTYGIRAVDPATPDALVCGVCGAAWTHDVTPAGRCPWEDSHPAYDDDDVYLIARFELSTGYGIEAREHASDAAYVELYGNDGITAQHIVTMTRAELRDMGKHFSNV